MHASQQNQDRATSDTSPADGKWLVPLTVDFNGLDCPLCGENVSQPARKNENSVEEATNEPTIPTLSEQRRLSETGETSTRHRLVQFSDPSPVADQSQPSLGGDSHPSSLAVTNLESPIIPIIEVELRVGSFHLHVARHLEEFALTALPRTSGSYDSDSNSNLDGNYGDSESNSTLGEFVISEQTNEEVPEDSNEPPTELSEEYQWRTILRPRLEDSELLSDPTLATIASFQPYAGQPLSEV